MVEPQLPHEALFLVLAYLNLFELLSIEEVCRSIREAVNNDVLLWLDIIVESPLNLRINDDILLNITSKAKGRLRTLALMNCMRITDDGLERIIENNPHINKLFVPGCTGLTPDGVVRIVKNLTEQNNSHNLKSLKLQGLYNTTKDHLQLLYSYLNINPVQEEQQHYMYLDYQHRQVVNHDERPIDIEICPKCKEVRIVFDCSRESCRIKKRETSMTTLMECIGCSFCIPRCEECGGCVDLDGLEETVCLEVVCSDCWLKLPKCNMCNKPYCSRHAWLKLPKCNMCNKPYCSRHADKSGWCSEGFVCDVCMSRTVNDDEAMTEAV